MVRKKAKSLCGILLAAAFAFSGCSSNQQGSQSTNTPQSSASATPTVSATPASDGSGPIVNEKVTYTMGARLSTNWGNPAEDEFFVNLEEETNIHVEWVTYLDTEAEEKYKLLMASGDYPDAFIGGLGGGDTDVISYGNQGIYISLNDLIDQYATNFNRRASEEYPDVKKMITSPDGNIYAMPSVLYNPVIYNSTFINKKWLDAVGAEVPTTTQEFEEVLKKFKTEDPNNNGKADEIPLSFIYSDWGASDAGSYFGAFGYPLPTDYVLIDQGKVVYLGAEESFKQGAQWLASLYSQNLLDKDIFTHDDSAYSAKISSDTVGVFSSWDVSSAGDYADDYVALMPLAGPTGENNGLREGITGFYKSQFIITDKAKNPEILMQWVDRFYKDLETGLNATYGIGPDENKSWYKDASGTIIWNSDMPDEYVRGKQQLPFAPAILGAKAESILMASGINKQKADIVNEALTYAKKFNDGTWERWPSTFITTEESEDLSTLDNDLKVYSKNRLAKWISNESDVNADWDSYIKELNKIGLSQWVDIRQQIYDRYNAAQ